MPDTRILVVEDEDIIAMDLQDRLRSLGYAVSAAVSSGEQAMQQVEKVRPDLVLMDIVLSGTMDGVQTTEQIQSRFDIPVIYLTAHADEDTLQRARATKPYAYILKPFDDDELRSAIELALYNHHLEQELRESEARFRSLIENTYDVVAILDVEQVFRYLSPSGARVLGYEPQDLVGKRLVELVAPEDVPFVVETIRKALLLPGVALPLPDYRMLHSDGSRRTLSAVITNLLDVPAVAGIVVNCHDITERKQAEQLIQLTLEKVERAKREWESTVDALPDLIALLDDSGCIIRANRTVEAWSLGRVTQVNGRTLHELIHGACSDPSCELDSSLNQAWEQAAQEQSGEWQLHDPVLNRHLLIKVQPVLIRKRETVVVLQDISERVQAEEQLKKLNENLESRANELAALNKASQAVVSTLDFESVLRLVIDEARQLLNAEGASLLLRDPASDELVFVSAAGSGADVLSGTRMPIRQGVAGWVIQNRQSALLEDAQNDPRFYAAIDKMMEFTTHSMIAVPLKFKGAVWGVVEVINRVGGVFSEQDCQMLEALTRSAAIAIQNAQLYQAEQELRRLVERSRAQLAQTEKLATTGRLAATLAHEINNPLQAIYNCVQTLNDFQLEPVQQQKYIQIALEEVERLTGTVKRVLDLMRRPQQSVKPMPLNQIVEKVLALTCKYLEHRHIALQRDLAPDLPSPQASPDELVQVFLNLVLNAADAMAEGGTLRVITRLAEDGRLTVAFADTGCGIPPENLERIFEPFFSTKEGGIGLGLDICNNVVRQHDGEITVKSQVAKGSTFTVWLPMATEQA